ncbi:translation initiation factor [Bradymonadaceae bacterium TMQ3]|uniref:Translation initiation factor n=1 Tax=Lujinxingia sediminis TaxID=2480984 RepID=A0ABY0CNN6_9DELT|nr:translation initiation factor [Lujinxingia sediminis]RDV36761.1 translation initiation factor [Bradymonadaceae bacterium TMQ3]RVU41568.1 translation initiation factor [Lujinxingia sediminis]TXC69384.1 translation initiation factor [Bradymonadales bacterium TMQ1]
MGKRKTSKKIAPDADARGFGHNPFAAHFGASPQPTDSPQNTAESSTEASSGTATLDLHQQKNLHLRVERKGRGGKTVTLLGGFKAGAGTPPKDALEDLVGQLKRALGCGAALEDDTIVLQGDQRERAASWLNARGATLR